MRITFERRLNLGKLGSAQPGSPGRAANFRPRSIRGQLQGGGDASHPHVKVARNMERKLENKLKGGEREKNEKKTGEYEPVHTSEPVGW